MKRAALCCALVLAAGTAAAQGIELKLSGQIDRALMHVDDGADSEWFNVDNGNSSTRFRFNAEGPVQPGWKAGILFEVEYRSNPSSAVTFAGRSVSPTLDERHMDVFVNGPYGTLRLGQGDGAANGASACWAARSTRSTTDIYVPAKRPKRR